MVTAGDIQWYYPNVPHTGVVSLYVTLVLSGCTNPTVQVVLILMDDNERFFIGDQICQPEAVVNHMQSSEDQWFETSDGTQLDPNYSEWSVRLHDRHFHSLSFIHRTIAILPKSRLESIYRLIGEYLGKNK